MAGTDGLAQLLVHYVASFKPGQPDTPHVSDRQIVDTALLALADVLQEAARRVADDAEEGLDA